MSIVEDEIMEEHRSLEITRRQENLILERLATLTAKLARDKGEPYAIDFFFQSYRSSILYRIKEN